MLKEIRGIAYTDIHHHAYDNGLTLDDTLGLEDQATKLANEYDAHLIIFNGDRFLSRNPSSSVRAAADRKMLLKVSTGTRRVVCITGNHDRETKNAHSGHSMMNLQLFNNNNLVVLDERVRHRLIVDGVKLDIHAVPADQSLDTTPFTFDATTDINICLFHNLVIGSWLQNGIKSPYGLDPKLLDLVEFDLVLGGDNHVHQQLDFKNNIGYYIGAPCQHNWGDVGQQRGFVTFSIVSDGTGSVVDVSFVPSIHPKFINVKRTIDADSKSQLLIDGVLKEIGNGNIVRLVLNGDYTHITSLVRKPQELADKIKVASKSRLVEVITEPTITFKDIIPALKQTKTPAEDWQAYVHSGLLNIGSCDPERVLSMGLETLHSVGDL